MGHIPADAPPEFGKGALPSPPDERDYQLPAAAAARVAGATSQLTAFQLGNRPPVTNQGNTSQCVAYSTAYEQNWQDRVDHGRFFDFDEATFFRRIGGVEGHGAFARAALDELTQDGYPVQTGGDAAKHQARVYTRVTQSVQAVKDAIVACGGVLGVGPWYDNWTQRSGDLQVLPPPSGSGGGHEVWYVGWDEHGIIGQNSWGTLWGDKGLFRMPWPYFIDRMFEVWTTLDERTTEQLFDKARIRALDVNIRTESVLSKAVLDPSTQWGETAPAGIRRKRDGRIVASPWNKAFRFGGFRRGPRHGIGRYPSEWGRLRIDGVWRCVARPLVRVNWD